MSLVRCWPGLASALGAVLVLLLAGSSSPAGAHPHVWITAVTTFLFEGPRLVGLRHRWQFDELFSSFVIDEHDVDGDGVFDPDELAGVREGAFSNLAEYGYFTHARIAGEAIELDEVLDFQASIDDGLLTYAFTLPLPEPIDPAGVSFAAGVYDPEYYVEVLLDPEDPVRFAGMEPGACIFDIREDADHPIYFGMVYPPVITLQCAVS
jgi:ABC-type uncharacterized transport system substrate-binding protein